MLFGINWGDAAIMLFMYFAVSSIETKIRELKIMLDNITEKTRVIKDIVEIMEEKDK